MASFSHALESQQFLQFVSLGQAGKASHLLRSACLLGGLWPADCWTEVFQDLP